MTRRAVIICDMWDAHHCVSAARRVVELASRMNAVVADLRARGALIIHAPADCVEFYAESPARRRAVTAQHVPAPVPFAWNTWDWEREGRLPSSLTDAGPCSCDTPMPCNDGQPPHPWSRQITAIEIASSDAISDDGQEVWNLLQSIKVAEVVVMGVHTNICVLSRWYGIRQLVYLGLRPFSVAILPIPFIVIRVGTSGGTQTVLRHIEQYWCPVKSSLELRAA